MSVYFERYAELYDIMYSEKPYSDEAAFVHDCLNHYGESKVMDVLELACGTGSHSLEMEKYNYNIIATDASKTMIQVARSKADKVSSKVDYRIQDMRNLDIKESSFDAVICLFDSIGYAGENYDLKKVMSGVYDKLKPGGLFIFEFWHAAAMLSNFDPVRVRRWKLDNGELLRISETSLDVRKQQAIVNYILYEMRNDYTYTACNESHAVRYFSVPEMEEWLTVGGFIPLKWFSGFSREEYISMDSWHILAVARKI